MSRGNSAAFVAALQQPHVNLFMLLEFGFDSGATYVAGLAHDVPWNGNTYLAALGLIGLESISEDGSATSALKVSIAAATPASIGLALGEPVQGRALVLRLAVLSAGSLLVDPEVWVGRMDTLRIVDTAQPAIVITAEARTAAWLRPRVELYSDAWQQSLHPGDTSLRYMTAIETSTVSWPDASYFKQ